MPHDRFFTSEELSLDSIISLDETESHHLKVMRVKENDEVEMVNGKGVLAVAKVKEFSKKQVFLQVLKMERAKKSDFSISLAQSIPRINRLDFIIEKATELGVDNIYLFPGNLSERKEISDHQLERLKAQSIAAMKQSGRLYLPNIVLKPSLKEWKQAPGASFFGDLDLKAPHLLNELKAISNKEITVFIGPESGFTKEEIEILKQFAKGVSLHPNILRTDTAALVALSFLSYSNTRDFNG